MTLLILNDPLLQPSEYNYALITPIKTRPYYKNIGTVLIGGVIGAIAMTPLGILIGAKIGLSVLLGGGVIGSYGVYRAHQRY